MRGMQSSNCLHLKLKSLNIVGVRIEGYVLWTPMGIRASRSQVEFSSQSNVFMI